MITFEILVWLAVYMLMGLGFIGVSVREEKRKDMSMGMLWFAGSFWWAYLIGSGLAKLFANTHLDLTN